VNDEDIGEQAKAGDGRETLMAKTLRGKVAAVTGAASGIGLASAEAMIAILRSSTGKTAARADAVLASN